MNDEDPGNRLGGYLRARRELVSPAQAGIPPGGNRRVPGLRREEVALLAGISPDYYLRLERGRDKNPSPQVLESIARSTSWPRTPWPSRSPRACGPARTGSVPCSSIPRNRPFNRIGPKPPPTSSPLFAPPSGTTPTTPGSSNSSESLALSSQRFRTLWARHDIRDLDGGTTTVHHPVVGELRLHRDKLPIGDVLLVVYYPDQDSDSDEKLRLLAALTPA